MCSICPVEVRDLYAVVTNLHNRLKNYANLEPCAITKKFSSVRESVAHLPEDYTSDDYVVRELIQMAQTIARVQNFDVLLFMADDIKELLDKVKPMVDRHFAECK